MPTPDKLNEAFEAWHRANDEHVALMRDITRGEAIDVETMTQLIGQLDALHATWMEMVVRRDTVPSA